MVTVSFQLECRSLVSSECDEVLLRTAICGLCCNVHVGGRPALAHNDINR